MNKRGFIAVGPALFFMPIISLLATSFAIIMGLGLVSGLVFNKHIKDINAKSLIAKLLIIAVIALAVILGVHYIGGPTSNHFIGMLFGALIFSAIISIMSISSFREDSKQALATVIILSFLFLLVSELSVFITISIN